MSARMVERRDLSIKRHPSTPKAARTDYCDRVPRTAVEARRSGGNGDAGSGSHGRASGGGEAAAVGAGEGGGGEGEARTPRRSAVPARPERGSRGASSVEYGLMIA